MSETYRNLQSAQNSLGKALENEQRQRALSDAIIERRLALARIPELSEEQLAEVEAEIMRRFPIRSAAPVADGPKPKQMPTRKRTQRGRL